MPGTNMLCPELSIAHVVVWWWNKTLYFILVSFFTALIHPPRCIVLPLVTASNLRNVRALSVQQASQHPISVVTHQDFKLVGPNINK